MTDRKAKKLIFTDSYIYSPKPHLPSRVYEPSKKAQAVNADCYVRALAAGVAKELKPAKAKDEG